MEILSFHKLKNEVNTDNQTINMNHRFLHIPLTAIELTSYQQLSEIEKYNLLNSKTIAITSQNAARWIYKNLNNWTGTIYTNSPKSQSVLLDMPNVEIIVSDEAYALNLGELLQHNGISSYIHLTGNLGLDDLRKSAEANGINYQRFEVYQTHLTPCKLNLNSTDVCVFTSPSQVDSFFEVNTWKKSIFALCIGKTTAKHLETFGIEKQNIYYPQEASYKAMMALLPDIEKKIEQQKTK